MNKIVREHYPASRLPAELREGIAPNASVKIIIEQETHDAVAQTSFEAMLKRVQERNYGTTLEEAVARVRALRDEWD